MKKILYILTGLFITSQANAGLISVSGPNSNLAVAASIIAAPANALDDNVTNSAIQGFNEAQGVLTSIAHSIDGGSIAAGTLVDSHMLFFNTSGNTLGEQDSTNWLFSGAILGVMSDSGGIFEANSTFELGAAGTNYTTGAGAAPFTARGLESNNGTGTANSDGYAFIGNTLTLSMRVTEPGDWIRVITASSRVPEPNIFLLLGTGLAVLGFRRRKMISPKLPN